MFVACGMSSQFLPPFFFLFCFVLFFILPIMAILSYMHACCTLMTIILTCLMMMAMTTGLHATATNGDNSTNHLTIIQCKQHWEYPCHASCCHQAQATKTHDGDGDSSYTPCSVSVILSESYLMCHYVPSSHSHNCVLSLIKHHQNSSTEHLALHSSDTVVNSKH